MSAIINGFFYPARAFGVVVIHSQLWIWVLAPFILNLVVFGIVFFLAWGYLGGLIETVVPASWAGWGEGLRIFLYGIVIVAFGLAFFYGFALVGNMLAAPFNSLLSQKAEKIRNAILPPATIELTWLQSLTKEIRQTFVWGGVIFPLVTVTLLLFNLIPVLGSVIYTVGMFCYAAFSLSFTFLEYALERRYRTLSEKFQWMRARRGVCFGFGAACVIVLAIPFVNVLMIPVCAVAGAMVFVDHAKEV